MRVGIFGGTFDPIHFAHLVIAEQCREQAKLEQVWFIPAARPPHKAALTPFERRSEMLQLAIAGNPTFRVEEIENERAGPSYTADTLVELRRRHPDMDWHLILGSDCLPDLPSWYEPARIIAHAKLVVVGRPGWPVWHADQVRSALRLPAEAALSVQIVPIPLIEIASRDLRRRVSEGRTIRYFVPNAVGAYIVEKKLYV